jgi:uncharacterized protein (DUF983 family)
MAASMTRSVWQIVLALLKQRCPVCLRGRVFAGWATMHDRCPVCDLQFEREPGYFMGAMYVSYGMSIGLLLLLTLLIHLVWENLGLGPSVLIAGVVYIPFVPFTWRYSRILWMYFDYWASKG